MGHANIHIKQTMKECFVIEQQKKWTKMIPQPTNYLNYLRINFPPFMEHKGLL